MKSEKTACESHVLNLDWRKSRSMGHTVWTELISDCLYAELAKHYTKQNTQWVQERKEW